MKAVLTPWDYAGLFISTLAIGLFFTAAFKLTGWEVPLQWCFFIQTYLFLGWIYLMLCLFRGKSIKDRLNKKQVIQIG